MNIDTAMKAIAAHRCNQGTGYCSCGHAYRDVGTIADDHARHVAQAAIDALQLTEDRRRINPQTRPKPCDNCGHLKGVHAEPCVILGRDRITECGCPEHTYTPPVTSWQSRLVSPWVEVSS